MATDISDKRLKELRNKRWERAFAGKSVTREAEEEKTEVGSDDELQEDVNRKATIVVSPHHDQLVSLDLDLASKTFALTVSCFLVD